MKFFKSNKKVFGIILLLVLALTNPDLNSFDEFSRWNTSGIVYTHRKFNLLIFSIYEAKEERYKETIWRADKGPTVVSSNKRVYIGILGNFIKISE